MNEIIDAAIDVFEKQILALYTNDFETFLSFMTPRIQKELTIDIFQKAIDLYKQTPIDTDAIDREKSRMYNEGESEVIHDRHIKLVLVGSGRTLCHVVNINGTWLIDDIYWRTTNLEENEEIEISENEIPQPDKPVYEPETETEPKIVETVIPSVDDNNIEITTEEEEFEQEVQEEEKIEKPLEEKHEDDEEEETTDEEHL